MYSSCTAAPVLVKASPMELEPQAETSCANGDSADASCGNHASVTADDSVAENLIGLDEGHIDDPCARFSVLQRKLEVFHKETLKLQQKEAQQEAAEPVEDSKAEPECSAARAPTPADQASPPPHRLSAAM